MKNISAKQENYIIHISIIVISAIFFIPFLGSVHLFDWDEINFAESAREMIVTGNYLSVQIDYVPFWEKPPLFIWMQVLSMKIFGINEFAARFPNVIAGIVSLLLFFNIGKRLYNNKFGLIWVLVYLGSILPFLYFKSGIIDPWFNLFIFSGLYFFILYSNKKTKKPLLMIFISAFLIGLSVLTKGPVGFLLFGLTAFIYMVLNKKYKQFLNLKVILIYAVTILFVGGFWFILQILNGNFNIIVDFIEYQIRLFSEKGAGHGGFMLYHFVVLFFGVFPASIFALKAFKKSTDINTEQKNFKQWMLILFWLVLILFTIVNTKIVHYSSLCYFPLSFLATLVIYNTLEKNETIKIWIKTLLVFVSFIIGISVIAIQFFVKYKDKIINSGLIDDEFAIANLQANVNWSGYEFLIGIILILGVIISIFFIKTTRYQIITIFSSTLIFVNLTLFFIVPKIEKYSQNAAISFYKEISNKDCYVNTYYFKSYAQYFYTKKNIPENKNSYDFKWLTSGNIDKPVYFICKITSAKEFSNTFTNFEQVKSENGFVFFLRKPL
ncbi:MAG: glycosyltransferase family 39 protein [Bacteroidales bacterium]|nr:glycosyltransferase family 39 protein [Bacteroidales bacterium]